MLLMLRFGPRQIEDDENDEGEFEDIKKFDEGRDVKSYGADGFFAGRDYQGALQDEKEPISPQRGEAQQPSDPTSPPTRSTGPLPVTLFRAFGLHIS